MNLRLLLTSSLLGFSLVACGGGGSTPTPLAPVNTPVTQSVIPSITTDSNGNAVLNPGLSNATLVALGLTGQPLIGGPPSLSSIVPAGTTVAYSNFTPTSVSTFNDSRKTLSATVGGATGLIYTSFTAPSTFTIPKSTSLVFTFPLASVTSGANYHLAFYNGASWQADTSDVGAYSNGNLTVAVKTPLDVTFSSGTRYAFALYSVSATSDAAGPTAIASGTTNISKTDATQVSATFSGSGTSGFLTIPVAQSIVGDGSVAYSIYSSTPTNVDPLTGNGVNTVIGYGVITPKSDIIFAAGSTATAALTVSSSSFLSGSYLLAYSTDGSTWVKGLGTYSTSGSTGTLSISTPTGNDVTLSGSSKYYIAIYK